MGKSHQKGWVVARGRKWYGYFRPKTSNPVTEQVTDEIVPVVLGLKSEMSKFEARDALEREIARRTGQLPVDQAAPASSVTFGWFVRKRYFLLKEADWTEETAKVKKFLIERDLLNDFEDIPLVNLDKFTLQVHLNQMAWRDLGTGCCRSELTCGTSSSRQWIKTTWGKTLRVRSRSRSSSAKATEPH